MKLHNYMHFGVYTYLDILAQLLRVLSTAVQTNPSFNINNWPQSCLQIWVGGERFEKKSKNQVCTYLLKELVLVIWLLTFIKFVDNES